LDLPPGTAARVKAKGSVSTESHALKTYPYTFFSRYGEKPGTNPEELLGAAHATCFTMSFVRLLDMANFVPEQNGPCHPLEAEFHRKHAGRLKRRGNGIADNEASTTGANDDDHQDQRRCRDLL
jgi:hypothetical protein